MQVVAALGQKLGREPKNEGLSSRLLWIMVFLSLFLLRFLKPPGSSMVVAKLNFYQGT